MATTLNMTLLLRRGEFSDSYVLKAGEPGYHTGTKELKIGDGSTEWSKLGFANQSQIEALIKVVDDKVAALDNTYATDAEVAQVKADLEAAILEITNELETYGDIVTHDASEFETAGAAAAVKSEIETTLEGYYTEGEADGKFETITNADAIRERVSTLETAGYATTGQVATAKQEAIDAAKTETESQVKALAEGAVADNAAAIEAINDETNGILATAKSYVDGRFTDADLGQYTTEQEVKDIVDEVITSAVDGDTITGLANLVEYLNTHGAEAKEMGAAIDVLEGKVETIEGKPAYGITATQVSNWDNEVGAKALAQGVKDVVDGNKATWDKAGTALQAADLADYAKSADVTEEIAEAVSTKLDTATYESYIAGKELSDAELKKYADDQAAAAQAAAEETAADALDSYKEEMVTALAGKEEAGAAAQALADAKAYADGLDHEDTTYTVAPTANALEFTVTPDGKGEAQTVKLVAPVVDTGVMSVVAGESNDVITATTADGVVTVSHKDYQTGTVKASDETAIPNFVTGITIENGHVTGATVQTLADALTSMEFILDCGEAE